MSPRATDRAALAAALLVASILFLLGITWGLPTPAYNAYLFGDRRPWTGAEILALAPSDDSTSRGADVDSSPKSAAAHIANATDADRAEIVRRYRLFSAQPDEMITFMALARMHPGSLELDPRLYQYGGLWIYPVGVLIKLAALAGLIDLHAGPDALAFYLDHPEAFARFYVVGRAYSAAWGLVAVAAVWTLARRFANSAWATIAAIAFASAPVVLNAAHEAKPHLAGVALMLWTCAFAFDAKSTRRAIVAAALAGAAVGMVLSSLWIVALLPVVAWRMRRTSMFAVLPLVAVAVYAVTNPYVVAHLIGVGDVEAFRSNLANSRAMYSVTPAWSGLLNALRMLCESTSLPLVALGVVGLFLLRREFATHLLAIVAACVALQFTLLATDKPGEYARFALFVTASLILFAFAGIARVKTPWVAIVTATIVLSVTAYNGAGYVWNFLRDASARPTRVIAADRLKALADQGATTLAVNAEPAPYCLPPIDLWRWAITVDRTGTSPADVQLRTVDRVADEHDSASTNYFRPRMRTLPALLFGWLRFAGTATPNDTPITWASKAYRVKVRPRWSTQK